ncbi:MAG: hypothetical protein AAGC77_06475 [Pseudomonadota bacterium]
MANDQLWFSYVNGLKTATITSDSEVSSLPVTNIVDRLNYRVWRSQSETAYFRAEWAAAFTWQAIVLQFVSHRDPSSTAADEIDPTDTIRIRASDVAAGGFELLDATVNSDVIRERGYFGYVATSPISGRYLEVQINASSRSSLGYFNLGVAHVGPLFQPNSSFSIGAGINFPEESLISVSPTGAATFADSRGRLLGFNAGFSLISESELDDWQAMQEAVGRTGPLALGMRTTGNLARKVMLGRFESLRFAMGENKLSSAQAQILENR